jgi:GxxExxY protein
MVKDELDKIREGIIGAAIAVHRALGPGLLESAYEACLAYELAERGCEVHRQVELPIVYRGVRLDCDYRIDLLVNNLVLIELKAVDELTHLHEAQVISFLNLSGRHVVPLINFNVRMLTQGIKRIVDGLTE